VAKATTGHEDRLLLLWILSGSSELLRDMPASFKSAESKQGKAIHDGKAILLRGIQPVFAKSGRLAIENHSCGRFARTPEARGDVHIFGRASRIGPSVVPGARSPIRLKITPNPGRQIKNTVGQ
jgi:hypothetical protein